METVINVNAKRSFLDLLSRNSWYFKHNWGRPDCLAANLKLAASVSVYQLEVKVESGLAYWSLCPVGIFVQFEVMVSKCLKSGSTFFLRYS